MAAPIILCDCAGMDEKRWLECREHGPKGDIEYTVGGSDVATIFGLSPWMTPRELWLIKKGRLQPKAKPNPLQLEMGHLLEPIAAHFYAQRTGDTVVEDTNLYQHADFPYALANVDRNIIRKITREPGVLECKSCTYHKAGDWADGAYPIHYEVQLRYYLAVRNVNFGAFSALWGNNPDFDLATPTLIRDKEKEDIIFEKLDQWIWSLRNDKPPAMTEVAPKLALEALAHICGPSQKALPTIEFPLKYEKSLRGIVALQDENAALRQQMKENEAKIEAYSVRIAELMKAHEHGVLTTTKDKLLVDFVTKTTRRVDSGYLKKEHPSIYAAALKASESRKVKVSVSPREWAQTAAVGIALRNAGFGLQFGAAGDSFDAPAVDELGGIMWSGNPVDASIGSAPPPPPAAPAAQAAPKPQPQEPELSPFEQALKVSCPIAKYSGKTLGEVMVANLKLFDQS